MYPLLVDQEILVALKELAQHAQLLLRQTVQHQKLLPHKLHYALFKTQQQPYLSLQQK
jgi:hypothetical protein